MLTDQDQKAAEFAALSGRKFFLKNVSSVADAAAFEEKTNVIAFWSKQDQPLAEAYAGFCAGQDPLAQDGAFSGSRIPLLNVDAESYTLQEQDEARDANLNLVMLSPSKRPSVYDGKILNGRWADEGYFLVLAMKKLQLDLYDYTQEVGRIFITQEGLDGIKTVLLESLNELKATGNLGVGKWQGKTIGSIKTGDTINYFSLVMPELLAISEEERSQRILPAINIILQGSSAAIGFSINAYFQS